MPKVTMTATTRSGGEPYLAGHTYEVDDATATHWVEAGLAETGAKGKEGEPTAHDLTQQAVAEQELEIAALHGDVSAARKLDAQRAAVPKAPAVSTGESARGALRK